MAPASTLASPASALVLAFITSASAFVSTCTSTSAQALQLSSCPSSSSCHPHRGYRYPVAAVSRAMPMASPVRMVSDSVAEVKSKVLQLAAAMDRGGMANPGVSNAYLGTKDDMRLLVESLAELDPVNKPLTAAELSGRWELVYTTVELFRASPFFQMVEAGYDDPEKSNLFFKLHQLQTGSWGASKIGRVTQTLDLIDSIDSVMPSTEGGDATSTPAAEAEAVAAGAIEGSEQAGVVEDKTDMSGGSGSLESEVDLIILPLTSVPLVGFWKLLPTFGGCIATKAKCSLAGDNNEVVQLVVESTKLKAVEDVPLLPLAGPLFEGVEFPTGEVTKKVMGNVPMTKQTVVYIDDTLRVMEDKAGELYIYAR
ncbi:unnamed protein product [Ectocarpus fasciculatus]